MSLWQLFANLKMRYGGSYDDAGEIAEDASKLNLDKIDVQPFPWRHLIAKTKHLVSCAGLVERILDGDEETIALSKVLQGRRIPVTSSKWQKHIDCLESWRVIRILGKGHESRWVSTYFAVPKGDSGEARSIFSGRGISEQCRKSYPVNILDVRDLLRGAAALNPSTICFFSLDLRHWFHQIDIGKKLERLFHIVIDGVTYSWMRLPMVWTWSPYVCQVLSWLLMLHEEPDDTPEDRIFDSSTLKADSPPSYLRFLGGEGFCDSVVRQFWSFHRKCRSDGESKDEDPP